MSPSNFLATPATSIGDGLNDLMDRYANGEDSAFAGLYDGLAPRLRAFLRRRTGDEALADDLTQQTFMQMHAARERYVTGYDVIPWAFAIARRLRIDALRKSGREVHDQGAGEGDSATPSPLDYACLRQTTSTLNATLHRLPAAQREVFELVYGERLTMEQVAELLGTTVMAVKLRLHRARIALRSAVGEADPAEGDCLGRWCVSA